MAVDTRDKRMSVIGMGTPGHPMFPNPDGSISSAAERAQWSYQYAGLLADDATGGHARRRYIFIRRGGRRRRR